jgi:hypothetical protein
MTAELSHTIRPLPRGQVAELAHRVFDDVAVHLFAGDVA